MFRSVPMSSLPEVNQRMTPTSHPAAVAGAKWMSPPLWQDLIRTVMCDRRAAFPEADQTGNHLSHTVTSIPGPSCMTIFPATSR
jgi:hypothetical protein